MAAIFDSDPRLLHDVQVGASHHQGGVSTGKRERGRERERERESEIRTGVNISPGCFFAMQENTRWLAFINAHTNRHIRGA